MQIVLISCSNAKAGVCPTKIVMLIAIIAIKLLKLFGYTDKNVKAFELNDLKQKIAEKILLVVFS